MRPKLIHDFAEDAELHLDDPMEMEHWSHEFGVAEQQLRDVAHTVGTRLRDIERELARPWAAYEDVTPPEDIATWEQEGGTDTSEHTGIADE